MIKDFLPLLDFCKHKKRYSFYQVVLCENTQNRAIYIYFAAMTEYVHLLHVFDIGFTIKKLSYFVSFDVRLNEFNACT